MQVRYRAALRPEQWDGKCNTYLQKFEKGIHHYKAALFSCLNKYKLPFYIVILSRNAEIFRVKCAKSKDQLRCKALRLKFFKIADSLKKAQGDR
jgi:hypothetical protein